MPAQGQADGTVLVSVEADTSNFSLGVTRARTAAENLDRRVSQSMRGVESSTRRSVSRATEEVNRFRRATDQLERASSLLTGPLGGIASRLNIIGNVTSVATGAVLGFSVAFAGLAIGLKNAISEAEKAERALLKTEAILRATGEASGLTAKELGDFADNLALATLATGEEIEAAGQKLLTFRSVSGETFKEAIRLSQDLAAVGFGSIESSAVQLGKALEDPVQGIGALSRVGVSFSAIQKESIKNFVETGRAAEAQAIILETLRKQVGGAGEAEAGGLSGAYNQLNERIGKLFENIGNTGPLQRANSVIATLARSVESINNFLFPSTDKQIDDLVKKRIDLQDLLDNRLDQSSANNRRRIQEQIEGINFQIKGLQGINAEEEKNKQNAIESSNAAKKQAEEERKLAAQIEKQKAIQEQAAKEAEQLKQRRRETVRSIQDEISALRFLFNLQDQNDARRNRRIADLLMREDINQSLKKESEFLISISSLYEEGKITLDQLNQEKEYFNLLSSLGLSLGEKEAEQIRNLLLQRNSFIRLVDLETQKIADRENAYNQYFDSLKSLQEEIDLNEQLATRLIYTGEVMESVEQKQRILNTAREAGIKIEAEQQASIDDLVDTYIESKDRLQGLIDKEEEAKLQAERINQDVEAFQQRIASGLTQVLFSTDSASQAFKRLALSISEAVVEAQLLSVISSITGIDGTSNFISSLATVIGGAIGGAIGGGGSGGVKATAPGAPVGQTELLLHQGGIVGASGKTRSGLASNYINAPRLHNGLRPDEFPAILQRGEAVISRAQVQQSRSRGGGYTQVINITTPNADSFRASERQIARMARQKFML